MKMLKISEQGALLQRCLHPSIHTYIDQDFSEQVYSLANLYSFYVEMFYSDQRVQKTKKCLSHSFFHW